MGDTIWCLSTGFLHATKVMAFLHPFLVETGAAAAVEATGWLGRKVIFVQNTLVMCKTQPVLASDIMTLGSTHSHFRGCNKLSHWTWPVLIGRFWLSPSYCSPSPQELEQASASRNCTWTQTKQWPSTNYTRGSTSSQPFPLQDSLSSGNKRSVSPFPKWDCLATSLFILAYKYRQAPHLLPFF